MRVYKLLLRGVLGITLCLLFLTGVLYADEPVELEIVPGDEELNLVGQVGADTRFEDGFRLVARGGDLDSITFDPSDLTDVTDDDNKIRFYKITMEPTTKPLSKDRPETFKVVVTGWSKPGTYSGQLHILKPGEPSGQGLTIPITLIAEATPEVGKEPTTAKLDPSLVRCRPGLGCGLAQSLLGRAATQRTREIRLGNTGPVAASLQPVEVVDVKGETGGYQLTAEDFDFKPPGTLSPKDSDVLKLTVKTDRIPPDQYKGTIRIPVEGQDAPVNIDVDLKVRAGLLVPMIVVVGGWLLGHIIKLWPAAEQRSRLLLRVKSLKEKIAKLDDKKDFETRLELIRQLIDNGNFPDARTQLKTLEENVQEQEDAEGGVDRTDPRQRVRGLASGAKRVVGWFSGIPPEFEARFVLWILQPLLYFVLVVWIIYLGIQQNYVGQATFGANPVADYVGLIIWAMSADIVGRTITNIGQA
jgi:hypothetical protein